MNIWKKKIIYSLKTKIKKKKKRIRIKILKMYICKYNIFKKK